jgi:hypothetical protein
MLWVNIAPELKCLYHRNEIACPSGYCPKSSLNSCSANTLPPTVGKSAFITKSENRKCASLEQYSVAVQNCQTSTGKLFTTVLEYSRNGCIQLERLGLEAGFFLIIANLEPNGPRWRGSMLPEEVQACIATNDSGFLV